MHMHLIESAPNMLCSEKRYSIIKCNRIGSTEQYKFQVKNLFHIIIRHKVLFKTAS